MSGLISTPTSIWMAIKPVDMRKGIDGLSILIQESLGHSPGSGSAFLFRNASGNRMKVVIWDGNGVWLCQRRLHKGCFVWPVIGDDVFSLSEHQWHWLVAGVDWQRLGKMPSETWQF
jgi:transposase